MTTTWGIKQESVQESAFYEGITLFERMKRSLYGSVQKMFNDVFNEDEKSDYQLPNIVVIGDESTGKSSLLEAITKCKIFPRDSKICTKFPIRVRLSTGTQRYTISYKEDDDDVNKDIIDKNEIYLIIRDLMEKIPDDQISENEIVVTISEPTLPSFELLDLPGIRSYPLETAKAIRRLYARSLKDKNTICLCVVPVITTRITAQQSIALISKYDAGERCILALTMSDKLLTSDIENLLVNRIIGFSDEFTGLNFAGCVAVANRTHNDSISMKDQDLWERKWFEQNVINRIPPQYTEHKDTIIKKITTPNLINEINKLYCDFIRTNWGKRVTKTIGVKIKRAKNQLSKLGSNNIDPDELNALLERELKDIFNTYNHNHVFPHNHDNDEDCDTQDSLDIEDVDNASDDVENEIDESDNFTCIKKCNDYEKYIVDVCDRFCRDGIYDDFDDDIDKIFKTKTNYKLHRFEKAKRQLKQTIKNNLHKKAIKKRTYILNFVTNRLENEFVDDNTLSCISKQWLRALLVDLFDRHILFPSLIFPLLYTKDDYIESDEYSTKRFELENVIEKYQSRCRMLIQMCADVKNHVDTTELHKTTISYIVSDIVPNINNSCLLEKDIHVAMLSCQNDSNNEFDIEQKQISSSLDNVVPISTVTKDYSE